MHLVELTEKLNKIALAIDQVDSNTLRDVVLDAQNCALAMQRETAEQMRRESRHLPYARSSPGTSTMNAGQTC